MKKTVFLDGVQILCDFRFDSTSTLFPQVVSNVTELEAKTVSMSDKDWERFLSRSLPNSAETEFSALTSFFSDALIPHDRILIHAVAFRFREKAYLILAPSGVGKSTQIKTLQELYPGEFDVICGDRPILRFCHSERSEESASPVPPVARAISPQYTDPGHSERSEESASPVLDPTIMVCPSPWNGKENWKGADAAPLAGIILLSRAQENGIYLVDRKQAVLHTFPQMIQTGRNPETIEKVAEMTTKLLTSAPVYHLVSCDIPDSTKLLYDVITGKAEAELPNISKPVNTFAQNKSNTESGEKTMTYKVRPGIVITKICGITTLLPTRAVMDDCPHVQCLPLLWGETWKAIRDEKPLEVILRAHEILTRQPREKVLADYQAFCKDLAQKGFLIEVPEKTGSENEKE